MRLTVAGGRLIEPFKCREIVVGDKFAALATSLRLAGRGKVGGRQVQFTEISSVKRFSKALYGLPSLRADAFSVCNASSTRHDSAADSVPLLQPADHCRPVG